MKYIIYIVFGLVLTACSIPASYIKEGNNNIVLNLNGESIVIDSKGNQTYKNSGCLAKSFFYEDDQVQVEYIRVKRVCEWSGLAEGLYQDFLQNNIKGLEKTSSVKIDHGDIYRFNKGQQYFYFISLYDSVSHTFIIDYSGEIASKILEKSLSINSANQLTPKLQKEFLQDYQFKGYFQRDRDNDTMVPLN